MNRYERYKDSGIPWLGEVPEHWEIKHINQIFKIHNGATPKTSEPDYWGDEIAWFTPKDLGDNKNKEIAASLKMITKEGYENCGVSLAPAKSIALSKRAPIGHLAITLLPAVVNQGCFLLEVLFPNDVNYLYYWLYANKSTLNSFGQGSTFMELPREKFAMLKISIPPEKEQTAIAHYLDTKLGEIDALIDKQQTLLEKLAEQRTAVITHAVTKGLNPAAPMKNSGVEWLGDVPAHWEVLSIKRLSQVKRGASPRPIDNPDYFDDDGEYAWVRIADVTASNMYLLETTQRLSDLGKSFSVPLQPNSLFLSIAGSVGKPIITKIKACIHDGFVYFPEYKNNIKFLYYIFCSGQPYLGLGKMGTQLNLNTDTVGAIKIALPPKEEQANIAEYLDQETAKIDRLCETVNQTIGRLKEYRTALITQAVTGKIKVTDE